MPRQHGHTGSRQAADNALARSAAEIGAACLGLARWYPAGAQQALQALPELDVAEIDAARLDDQAELQVWAGCECAADSAVAVAKAIRARIRAPPRRRGPRSSPSTIRWPRRRTNMMMSILTESDFLLSPAFS
ncbi:MAG: hypothetical protein BGP24_10520 [Lysobacterales bacterium 69-70]|nr:MAG: hypothetical protein ABS97_13540 [Xanthomonadaceae bacterium SCN 69-320]ODV18039.1 MAG: hypothetical protein ABT27_15510 [Xanthomonadaceae bacterium SCN 69-25]OJZ00909.1 MAG: hypothetical protein BGP24_10520 [Xanthomonadales bacterium 69-70]